MSGLLLRAAGLAGIYLLVMTSLDPGDVIVGAALGLTIAVALRPHQMNRSSSDRVAPIEWLGAFAGMLIETAREMIVGSWRVVRFCLGGPARPGFVEIPVAAVRGRAWRSGKSSPGRHRTKSRSMSMKRATC